MTNWQPPDEPEPRDVLNEAVNDMREGLYETALAKFVWHHDHILENGESRLSRLSFGLLKWIDLAKIYPPAMDALYAVRERARQRVLTADEKRIWFRDLVVVNRKLSDFQHTVDVFRQVLEQDDDAAADLYSLAEPAIIKSGAYSLCNAFLDPVGRIELAARPLEIARHGDQPSLMDIETVNHYFAEDVTTLVALLVLNRRYFEAHAACAKAYEVIDNESFRKAMDIALTGKFPAIDW